MRAKITFSLFATSPERDILLSIIFWPTPMTERFRSKELDMANLLWKLRPSKSWPTADATVDSCQWVRLHDHLIACWRKGHLGSGCRRFRDLLRWRKDSFSLL